MQNYSATAFRIFRAAYNKCIKKLFGYARCDYIWHVNSLEIGLPTADAIVRNSHMFCFASHYSLSCNQIVEWFANIAVW